MPRHVESASTIASGHSFGDDLVDERVLGREHHVGGAEQRVGAGREHLDVEVRRGPRPGTTTSAPTLRPIQLRCIILIDSGQSSRSRSASSRSAYAVMRSIHCFERALVHRDVAAVAAPVGGDLLVGEHGAERRAPVHRRLVEVREPVRVDDRRAASTASSSRHGDRRVGVAAARAPASSSAISSAIGRARSGVVVVPGVEDLQEDPLRPAVVRRRRWSPTPRRGSCPSPSARSWRRIVGDVLPRS